MEQELNQEIGIIKISDDVVGIISGLAANEIKGIHSMSTGFVEGITSKLSGKKNVSRGVKVNFSDDNATIDIYVIVEYGFLDSTGDDVEQSSKCICRSACSCLY